MELVSVIIPCYNSGSTIQKTIDSIKKQTWQNIEIIVIDDGSDELNTCNVLSSLEGVQVFRQKNLGLPAARNAGFKAAVGKYVLPLDADDWIAPETISIMMSFLIELDDIGFVYSDIQLEGESAGVLSKDYNFFEQLSLNQLQYSIFLSKKLWEIAGGYDETMENGYEDWEFNIRLGVLGYYGVHVPMTLFHYRVSSTGMLMSKSNRMHGILWSDIQDRHRETYKIRNLVGLYLKWSKKPSRYPLYLHLLWIIIHKFLPVPLFSLLFSKLKKLHFKS